MPVIAAVIAVALAPVSAAAAIAPPLRTIAAETTPPRCLTVRVGGGYVLGGRLLFREEDKNRMVYYAPDLRVAAGVSDNMELVMDYRVLFLQEDGRDDTWGTGDLRITGVCGLFAEGEILPETAFTFGMKLPNADDEKNLGTDETDVFIGGAFSKRIGDLRILCNAGLGILGNPSTATTEQDDVLVYGVGFTYDICSWWHLACELDGIANSRFGNDRMQVRYGMAFDMDDISLDVSGGHGLDNGSPDYFGEAGVTFSIGWQE
jgi:hypothetical protein